MAKLRSPMASVRAPSAMVFGGSMVALERLLAVVAGARLDAVDAQARLDGRPREGRAGEQPSTAQGRDDGVDLGPILHDLEGDGPGAGDDPFVVEWGDHGRAALRGDLAGDGVAGGRGHADCDDLGSVGSCGLDFGDDGAFRHDDGRLHPEESGGERHALGVVSGGEGHHPIPPLVWGELEEGVHGPADLERPGALQILALEADFDPHSFRNRPGLKERRSVDVELDAGGGGPDIFEAGEGADI